MLHWMRWRQRFRGATWLDSVEVKSASFWLREGGGWEECMEMGGASTGGIANVNLENEQENSWAGNLNIDKRNFSVLALGAVVSHQRKKKRVFAFVVFTNKEALKLWLVIQSLACTYVITSQ